LLKGKKTRNALSYGDKDKRVSRWWKLQPVEQQRFNVRIGVDYLRPVVDLFKSAEANEKIYNAATPRHQRPTSKRSGKTARLR
jgi:deoxyribodipyrimidine photo-lyase